MSPTIFLDWDGVVIDSLEIYLELLRNLCHRFQKTLPVKNATEFRDWYQPNWEINFQDMGFSTSDYEIISATYPAELDYSKAPLFAGITEMLDSLSRKHRLVVVSTAPTKNIEDRLREVGLLDKFAAVTGSDDGSTDKADRLGCLMRELSSERGVMVGDTDLDIMAGRANGLTTVGVTYGWINKLRMESSRPDLIVDRPADLEQKITEALLQEARKGYTVDGS